jgi:hypothetical protein
MKARSKILAWFALALLLYACEGQPAHAASLQTGESAVSSVDEAHSFPRRFAATALAHVALRIRAIDSGVLECRSFRERDGAPAFARCPVHEDTLKPYQNVPSADPSQDGAYRTELRVRFDDGSVSPVESYPYYVHSSLNDARRCGEELSDEAYFDAAAAELTPVLGERFAADVRLRSPFLHVTYRPALAGRVELGEQKSAVEMLSLRRRFALNGGARAGQLLLIRRAYASTHTGSCTVYHMERRSPHHDAGSSRQTYGCEAVVIAQNGAGVCLTHDAANAKARVVRTQQGMLARWLGGSAINPFMWRDVAADQEYTAKCDRPGCAGLYLPDQDRFQITP